VAELLRLLRPGGRALVYVWAREQENPAKTLDKWAPIDCEQQERALAAEQVWFALRMTLR
jgi:hypothetical protein